MLSQRKLLMQQKPQINIPAGKSIKTLSGKRTFRGPMVLQITAAMKLQPTYCDGTRWQYKHQEDAAKALQEEQDAKPLKDEVVEESIEKEEIEKSKPVVKETKPIKKSAPKKRVRKRKKADVSNVSSKTKKKPASSQGDENNSTKGGNSSGDKKKKV